MNSSFEMMQKIISNGADEIKPEPKQELDMCNGCCPVSYRIVKAREFPF